MDNNDISIGERVIPNPKGVTPEWDSEHVPKAKVYPGGAVMNAENAPLEDGQPSLAPAPLPSEPLQKAFPELKGSHEDHRQITRENATQAAMRRAGVDMNLENYLTWAYMGNPPDVDALDGEDIAMLPPDFQKEVQDMKAKEERAKTAKPSTK